MIKAAEGVGMHTGAGVRLGKSVRTRSAAVKFLAAVEAAAAESLSMIELPRAKFTAAIETRSPARELAAIDEGSAMRDENIVVENHSSGAPIKSPVVETPPKSTKEAKSKASAEQDPWASNVESGI